MTPAARAVVRTSVDDTQARKNRSTANSVDRRYRRRRIRRSFRLGVLPIQRPDNRLARQGRSDELPEERMRTARSRLEFRMELAANEPGMRRQLHGLHQRAVGRKAAEQEAVSAQ